MTDTTFSAVFNLWEHDFSKKEIARKLNLSHGKVTKILVTIGAIETEEAQMLASGMTVKEIAAKLDKTEHAVFCRVPYSKGVYDSDNPSPNAIRIRECRARKQGLNENNSEQEGSR